MKMTKEHYNFIKGAISCLDKNLIKEHKQFIIDEGKAKDINKRLRWDCFHATKIKIGDGIGQDGLPLYSYLNDDHIDTALRNIIKELNI